MNFQTVQPNVYDAIAGVHQATIVPASRFGCGFLGFNRIFLLRWVMKCTQIGHHRYKLT